MVYRLYIDTTGYIEHVHFFYVPRSVPPFQTMDPLHQAIVFGTLDRVRGLLKAGVDIKKKNITGKNALHVAAWYRKWNMVALLLAYHADLHAVDAEGNTPLHLAAQVHDVHSVDLLLQSGARINAPNGRGQTPLHLALEYGRGPAKKDTIKRLLIQGAQPNFPDQAGHMPLHIAVQQGVVDAAIGVQLVLDEKAGVDLDAVDLQGRTPLHLAVCHNHLKAADLLLEAGAAPDIGDADGNTPLHLAAAGTDQAHFVILLRLRGADRHRKNKAGYTACDLALQKKNTEIVSWLEKSQPEFLQACSLGNLRSTKMRPGVR